MKNFQVVVTASKFGRESLDKNGAQAIYLTPLYGKMPNNSNVLAGTFAANLGIEAGKMYSLTVVKGKIDVTYGQQYDYVFKGEVSSIDELTNSKAFLANMGVGELVEVITEVFFFNGY